MNTQVVELNKVKISKASVNTVLFFVMMVLFFATFNNGIINTPIMAIADEIFLMISVCTIFYLITKKLLKGKSEKIYLVLMFYIAYQIINYHLSPFSLNLGLVLLQSLINIKVFIVSFAILLLWNNNRLNRKIVKNMYYLFIGLFLTGMFMNFILQETWHVITAHSDTISYRYKFIRPVGWLGSSGQNGYFFAITFVTLFLLYSKKRVIQNNLFIKKFFIFTIVDYLIAFPLTVRKGMMMVIPFGLTTFLLLKGKKKYLFIVLAFSFLALFLFIIKDSEMMQDTLRNFGSMTNDEDNSYIRGLMIFYGFSLFLEFFPFGVGNATFGTVLSQFNTLEVYSYVGLNLESIYYKTNKLSGVYDSGFFSMLAENGFIGTLLIFSFIYYFFKINKRRLDDYNYLIFKIITWYAIILSLTEPVWQNGMFTVIYVINLLFIYTKNNIYRENGKWIAYEK
jgi:hypothetical protein